MSRRLALLLEAVLLAAVLAGGGWLRLQLGKGWAYGGIDTWAYVGAAVELRDAGRYAVRLPKWFRAGPQTPPLSYCRPPGYSLFLLAIARPTLKHDDPYVARTKGVQIWLDLLTCVLVFGLARHVGGRSAAWPAVVLTAASPLLAIYTVSLMAETLAATLTIGAVLALAIALEAPPARARWLQVGAGALVGLGMLLRPDGLLAAPCLLVPLVVGAQPWRRRVRDVALALLACGVVFAPWPIRNLVRFRAPHPYGAVCDREAKPIPRTRFLRWFGTWVVKEEQLPKTLWCFYRAGCAPNPKEYPPEAFGSPLEKKAAAGIFKLHAAQGHSKAVDRHFHNLALYRFVMQPFRTAVVLPAKRAYHLWLSTQEQSLRAQKDRPLPPAVTTIRPHLGRIAKAQAGLAALGLCVLLLPARWGGRRRVALLVVVALGSRTGFLALTGMVEGRYIVEVMPVALALGGVALGWLVSLPARVRAASRAD